MIGLDDIFTRLETALEAGGITWWEMELPSGVVFFSENKITKVAGIFINMLEKRNFG